MRIGVNARLLTKPFTGIGQYTRNLFRELAKIDSENEYILVVPDRIDPGIEMEFPKNVKIKIISEPRLGTVGMKKTWWEQMIVPEFFVKEKVDIAFFPYPSNPWTKDFYKKNIKTIVTVHDCIPWIHKKYRRGLLSKLYHSQTKKAVKLTDIVFTVSEVSKKEIIKTCDVQNKKIHVFYNDASDSYKKPLFKEYVEEVLGRFSLNEGKFFLYVGGFDERKNIEYLKEEYSLFAKKNNDAISLVLVGGKMIDSNLYSSFDKMDNFSNIIRTGFLEEDALAALYRSCLAFVNVSMHEGFNIPILEAANCEAPLILSDIEVHREVAGNNALYVNASKKGELAHAFEKMLLKKNQEGFSKDSKELAKKYSWNLSAQKVKDMLFSN